MILRISKGVVHMFVATFFFALMNVCIKYLRHIPSHEIVLFRSVISLFICYIQIRHLKIPLFGNNKKLLITRGLFGSVALLMFFYTLQHMPLASAATVQYLSPIFTAIFAVILLKENLKLIQYAFFIISFIGVILVKGFDARVELNILFIGIGAAIFSGLAYNVIRKLKDTDHPIVVIFYFPLVTIPIILPISLTNWVMPYKWDWIFLILIGVLTQIAQVNMTKAYQLEPSAKVASVSYFGIILALIFGYLFFNEVFGFLSLVGMLLVMSGVILNIAYSK